MILLHVVIRDTTNGQSRYVAQRSHYTFTVFSDILKSELRIYLLCESGQCIILLMVARRPQYVEGRLHGTCCYVDIVKIGLIRQEKLKELIISIWFYFSMTKFSLFYLKSSYIVACKSLNRPLAHTVVGESLLRIEFYISVRVTRTPGSASLSPTTTAAFSPDINGFNDDDCTSYTPRVSTNPMQVISNIARSNG